MEGAVEPEPRLSFVRGRPRFIDAARSWLADPGGRAAALLGVLAAGFIAWQFAGWGGAGHRTLISDVAFIPVSITGAWLAWRAAGREDLDNGTRRAWKIIAVSFFFYWIGDTIFTLEENLGSAPFPSIADAAYIVFYPLLLWGVLSFPTAPQKVADRAKLWLDTGTVMLGGYMVLWYFALGPTAKQVGSTPLETFVSMAYPIGDLVLIFAITRILLRQPASAVGRAITILAVGLVLFVIADVAFAALSFSESYEGGDWPDSLWMVAQVLFAIAAQYQFWRASRQAHEVVVETPRVRQFSPLPYLAVFGAFGLLSVVGWHEAAYPLGGLMLGAVGITALVVSRQVAALRENLQLMKDLHELASTDVLTGLQSRRNFFETAEREFYLARRHGRPLSAMMIDIDHFKTVNDTYGHATGDAALEMLAHACRDSLRMTDLLGRYGGDELVALLPESDVDAALEAAARIRAAVDDTVLEVDGHPMKVTISVGVSTAEGAADLAQLLRRADRALYEAKQAGRNTTRALSA